MANRNLATTITIGGAVSGALMGAIGRTQGQLRNLGNSIRQLTAQQRELAAGTGKNTTEYARLTAQVDRLRAAQSRLAQIERQRKENLQRRDQLAGEIGQGIGTAAAVNLPIIGSVQQAAEFGYQLQLIGNTANMTAGEVSTLGAEIMRISRETSNSATDVQRAMGFLIAAGLNVGDAQAQLGTIGRTATATGSDIEDVAKAAFVLGDALKIRPEGMQDALESLVVAGKNGNFEFRDMAAELPVLGAGFSALKMTGADAIATMGAALQIARKGAANSSEAANNMANFMAKLLSPETLRKAETLGSDLYGVISGAQARGENPFEAAIAEIQRITDGGDQKKLGELFADMQVQNFLRPMLQNLDEYNRIKNESLTADGVIAADFERVKGTLKKQLGEIGSAFQRLAIKVGEALGPVIESVGKVLVPLIDQAAVFVSQNPKLVGGILAAVSAFTALNVVVKAGLFAFTYFRGAWLAVQGALASARGAAALGQIGTAAANATGWFARLLPLLKGVGAVLGTTISGPVLLIGATLVAAGALVIHYWERVKAFFVGFGAGVMESIGPVFDRMGQQLAPLGPAIEWIGRGFGIMRDLLVEFLTPAKATAEELAGATEAGRTFGNVVGTVLGALVDVVTAPIRAIATLGEAIGTAAGWIVEKLNTTSIAGRSLTDLLVAGMDLVVQGIGAPIRGFVMLGEAIGTAAGWIVTKFDGIGTKWAEVMFGVSYLWDVASAKIGGGIAAVSAMWQSFGAGVAAIWDGIQTKIGAVVDWLLLKIAPLMNGISWVGDKAAALGSMIGLGDAPAAAGAAAQNLPQPAPRSGAGTTVNNTTTNTITVNQQPGQDGRALAAEIDRKMRERENQRQRGALYDPVAP